MEKIAVCLTIDLQSHALSVQSKQSMSIQIDWTNSTDSNVKANIN